MHTKNLAPWTVSMQRPAPGGNVRSAYAATEIISATAIRVDLFPLSICPGNCDGGWSEPSTYDLKKIQRAET